MRLDKRSEPFGQIRQLASHTREDARLFPRQCKAVAGLIGAALSDGGSGWGWDMDGRDIRLGEMQKKGPLYASLVDYFGLILLNWRGDGPQRARSQIVDG